MKYTYLFLMTFLVVYEALAQVGSNDPTFNVADFGARIGEGPNYDVYTSATQNNGKIIIGGVFTTYDGVTRNCIGRLNADGSLDTSFNTGTIYNFMVQKIIIQNDGRIIVGGSWSVLNKIKAKLVRLNSNGTLDTTFSQINMSDNSFINSIAVQSDGKMIIGGVFDSINGFNVNNIARINVNGSIDNTFNVGAGTNNIVNAVAIQSDGRIIIGGAFTQFNSIPREYLARLNQNGTLDYSFYYGTSHVESVASIVIQGNGKVIIGGYRGIDRLNPNGSKDTSFSQGSLTIFGSVSTIALQTSGKVIVGGNLSLSAYFNAKGIRDFMCLDTNGRLDSNFDHGLNSLLMYRNPQFEIKEIAVQNNGQMIVCGSFNLVKDNGRNNIARVNANGTLDHSFNPPVKGLSDFVTSMVADSSGKIIITGEFTSYNGVSRNRIVRINPNGSIDSSFNTGIGVNDRINACAIQHDGKVLIGGNFTSYNGAIRYSLARINVNGSLDTNFNYGQLIDGDISKLIVQNDGKVIVTGGFTRLDGEYVNYIGRINIDGSIDTSFKTGIGPNSRINNAAILPNGKIIVVGNFTTYNGLQVKSIARINTDGSLDSTFYLGSGVNGNIVALHIQSDGKILIGGDFTTYDGKSWNRIARLNENGSADSTFLVGTGFSNTVMSIVSQSNGKIIVGGRFTQYKSTFRRCMARLNSDGNLDNTFNHGTGANDAVTSIVFQNTGGIVIGGYFTSYNGTGRNRIARVIRGCSNTTGQQVITRCHSYTWIDGNTYTSSNNTAKFVIPNSAGCDSIITLNLTILKQPTYTDTQIACRSFTWIDGRTYTSSNDTATFKIVGGAKNGCDSIIKLNLIIQNPVTYTDVRTACKSFTWIDGNTYISSDTMAKYTLIGGAANGCDSVIRLRLTILNPQTATEVRRACKSYKWIDGNTYTSNNDTAKYTIIGGAKNGCDSVITLNLTIFNPTIGTDVRTACKSFTWIDKNTYTANNNTATYNIVGGAANGCDSIVKLNLTINTIDTSISVNNKTITANLTGATYQWLDCNTNYSVIQGANTRSFTPTNTGDYAVKITNNLCVDTSSCVNVVVTGLASFSLNEVKIYPNPVQDMLVIDFVNQVKSVQLSIFSIEGKLVYDNTLFDNNEVVIDATSWKEGVYIARIKTKDNIQILKVLKE
ncbi:MAG: T9SS C-terminal target domain-containing protein [Bacteroidetes bacterium]|nr:MAG: T9SS C-terminal target domain-containing protein [Bacteroidota bacterium]